MAGVKGQPAPKPNSTPDPVPGQAEASEFSAFMSNLPKDSEFGAALNQAQQSSQAIQEPVEQGNQQLAAVGDVAARGLDYVGGIARGGAALGTGVVNDLSQGKNPTENPIVKTEDIKDIFKGKGPTSEEYLKRLGIGEGSSLTVPGTNMRITQRGASGLALDILSDPLTALSKLAKEIPAIGKIINLPGAGAEAFGEALYKSSLKKIDAELADKGAGSVADIMIKNGAPIQMANVAQKASDMQEVMRKVRQGLYDKATAKGVSIDTGFPLKRTEAALQKMRRDPGLMPAAEDLQSLMDSYKDAGKVSLAQMSEWKTNLYDALPQSSFAGNGRLRGQAKQFKAALAADFREAIADAGNTAEKGLGDAINTLNEKWGTLIQAEGPLAKANKAGPSKLGILIDSTLLSTGNIKEAAVRRGLEMATSPTSRRMVGKAAMEAGKNDFTNSLFRQSFQNSMRPGQPQQNVDFNSLPTQVNPQQDQGQPQDTGDGGGE